MEESWRRADYLAAQMPWLYYNAHRGKAKPEDIHSFLLITPRPRERTPSGAEIIARFRALKRTES